MGRDKSIHRFIEDMHGKHGGSPESEGRPQSDNADPGTDRDHLGGGKSSTDEDSEKQRLSRELVRDHKPVRGDEGR